MTKIIAIHSPRSGNGVSTIAVNLAAQLAAWGKCVCVVDANIPSPSIAYLTNLDSAKINLGIDDFLLSKCQIKDTLVEISNQDFKNSSGRLFVIPSSAKGRNIAQFIKAGIDYNLLMEAIQSVAREFDDVILDLPSGFSENTLFFIALSDTLLEVSNPHAPTLNDFAFMVDAADSLDIPEILLLINLALPKYNADEMTKQYEKLFQKKVSAVLQLNFDVVDFPCDRFFILDRPQHPFSRGLAACAKYLNQP